jgi:hypothetical protein
MPLMREVNCVTPAAVRTPLFAQMTQAHIDYMLSKTYDAISELADAGISADGLQLYVRPGVGIA